MVAAWTQLLVEERESLAEAQLEWMEAARWGWPVEERWCLSPVATSAPAKIPELTLNEAKFPA